MTLQAGGHWINIGAGGISSSVPIEVGGAPMAVMSAASGSPGSAEKLVAAAAPALSLAQILSFQGSAPFCEECERCRNGACAAPPVVHKPVDVRGRA
ncbi:hypothetical protein D3C84_1054870 [compost metagenome]